ncbi:MAG: general secretion pathway protein GspK [Verrucomicrobiae bacterium]|nr:general secretion pathway protein GspK [Verrucomicrobiae bacterium]
MMVIIALTVIASAFAYSMKVEMRLAAMRNADSDMEWMARSGLEFAKFVLGQQLAIGAEPYDGLNQKWAGGSGGLGTSNSPLAGVELTDYPLGDGAISLTIEDTERWFNINTANPLILRQALIVVGAEPALVGSVADAILDWMDPDDDPRLAGTESPVYMARRPSHMAKNGPFDDISELLMVEGVSEELFYGDAVGRQAQQFGEQFPNEARRPGLSDLFTTISSGRINLNTASADTLQVIPGLDYNIARSLIQFRAGADGMTGTEDDRALRTVGEIPNVPGLAQIMQAPAVQNLFTVRSATFQISVRCRMYGLDEEYIGLIRRNSPSDLQVLSMQRHNIFKKSVDAHEGDPLLL